MSVFAAHFLLGDIAVSLKLKMRPRYTEKIELSGVKNCSSAETENGKFLPKRRIFLEMTTQWKHSSLMHSLLSEHYLYCRRETQCGRSYLVEQKNRKSMSRHSSFASREPGIQMS